MKKSYFLLGTVCVGILGSSLSSAHAENTFSSSSLSNKKSLAASSGAETESKTSGTVVLFQDQWETLQKQLAQLQNSISDLSKEKKQSTAVSIFITHVFIFAAIAVVGGVLYDYLFRFKRDNPGNNIIGYILSLIRTKGGNSLLDVYSTLDVLIKANKDGKLLETVLKNQKVKIVLDETDKKTGQKVQKETDLWELFSPYLNNQGNNTLGNYILEQVKFTDGSNLMQLLEKYKNITDQLTPLINALYDGSIVDYMLDSFTITVCETIDRSDIDLGIFNNFTTEFLKKAKNPEDLENKEVDITNENMIDKIDECESYILKKEEVEDIVDERLRSAENAQTTNAGFYKFLSEFSSSEDCKFLKYYVSKDKHEEKFLALNGNKEIVSKFTYKNANLKDNNIINNNDGDINCKFEIQKKFTLRSLLNDPINLVHNLNEFVKGLNDSKENIVEYILKNQKIGDKTLWEIFSPVLSLFTGGSFDEILKYEITAGGKKMSINELFVKPIVNMLKWFTSSEVDPVVTAFRNKMSAFDKKSVFYKEILDCYGSYIKDFKDFEKYSKDENKFCSAYIEKRKSRLCKDLENCRNHLSKIVEKYHEMFPDLKKEEDSNSSNIMLDICELVDVILKDKNLAQGLSDTKGFFTSGNAIGALQYMGGNSTKVQLRPKNRFSIYSAAKSALQEVDDLLNKLNNFGRNKGQFNVNSEGLLTQINS